MKRQILSAILAAAFFYPAAIYAQIAQSGAFTLDRSVVAAGGGTSGEASGVFSITGTIGQTNAGTKSQAGQFVVDHGFWTPATLAPTAGNVTISGRIRTDNGIGIRNVLIILTEANGTVRSTASTGFGYYQFTGVAAGQTVIVSVTAKKYSFSQPTHILNLTDEIAALDFVANPQ